MRTAVKVATNLLVQNDFVVIHVCLSQSIPSAKAPKKLSERNMIIMKVKKARLHTLRVRVWVRLLFRKLGSKGQG